MSKLALSRCAGLVAVFAVLGGLLAAGPSWGVPSTGAPAMLDPLALSGLVALVVAVSGGGWVLARSRFTARQGVLTAAARSHSLDDPEAAVILIEQRADADAIAAAVQVFQDGLSRMGVGEVPAPATSAPGSIAAMAAQTSVMALRATLAAAQGAAAGDGFRGAAARVKALAEQAAIASQACRIAAAPDQDLAAGGRVAEPTHDVRAASAPIAAMSDRQETGRRLSRTVRAA
ncbi:hypothetical protein [Methylobacterium sp. E-066]|uniref:hypothetical protein n=1 Tax=Methylobacterium sp. E-066 TaxID=2836584 RepID=UPI001FB9B62A|nr:hypothetical protein [Methylobacterium sp. E-066]MCJ2144492.1 hypothetical protein [Methylobacterium sp. E-066]